MSNVLDLKYRQPGIIPEEQAVLSEEPAAEVAADPEPSEADRPVTADDIDDMADAALSFDVLPVDVSWEAHHPLLGEARFRHQLYLGGLVLLGGLIALWQGSVLIFFTVTMGAVALGVMERWGRPVSVAINEQGVSIDGRMHAHADFVSFDIHRMPDATIELSLKSQRKFVPTYRLPLGVQDPDEVHAVLTQYVPEGQHKIPLIDYYVRKPRA